ncbi:MAG: GTPase Era [Paludibacteraceae bacterium]|nr:GTPase Era [Paludibacteraceae bacterium]
MHKAGFVNIVGNPNVGKSTLANALVGERLSIITSKAQTTRHRIMGIVNGDDYQIVYSDTPGVLKPNYKLQESMLGFSVSALSDADILLYVTDPMDSFDKNEDFLQKVKLFDGKTILIVNKIDLIDQSQLEQLVEFWHQQLPKAEIFAISAKEKFNIEPLFYRIKELLPDSPPFFDKDALTDKPERFFVTEIIREKILLHYEKEIPYSVEVVVEEFKEDENIIRISALIYCERDSQKGILIGKQGKSLRRVGIDARKDIETFFAKKVFLQLFVKVEKDWRNRERKLRSFGYQIEHKES